MKTRRALILIVALFAVVSAAAQEQPAALPEKTLAIVGGTLIDPRQDIPIKDSVILIRGDRITEVGVIGDVIIPDDAEVVRAKHRWIIPGLIDAHIHFFQSGGLYTRPDVIDLRKRVPYAQEIAAIEKNLPDTFARYLRCGITGVADAGGPRWNFKVRERARATAAAPRVAITGPLISTYQPSALTTDDPPILKVSTPEEARAEVNKQIPQKPAYIKIWFIVRQGETIAGHEPVVRAVIEESHAHGFRVAVHATELETARAVVTWGADILVHSVFDKPVDEAFVALLKEKGVIYCPTLMVMGRYREVLSQQISLTAEEHRLGNPWITCSLFDLRQIPIEEVPERRRALLENPPKLEEPTVALQNLARVHQAGVTVAAGTDAGNIGTLHGPSLFAELALMQKAGLSPRQVLLAATEGGAKLMGREKELGTIAPGMLADLVVLTANPLVDLAGCAQVDVVLKGGKVFRAHELIGQSPVDVVQHQVNAYNARAIDVFAATFSPDVDLYRLGENRPFVQGRAALRQYYAEFFATTPKLHCEVLNRIHHGKWVIDHEKVTGLKNNHVLRAVAVYQIELGMIRRVWFGK